jgi:hypothetical protein
MVEVRTRAIMQPMIARAKPKGSCGTRMPAPPFSTRMPAIIEPSRRAAGNRAHVSKAANRTERAIRTPQRANTGSVDKDMDCCTFIAADLVGGEGFAVDASLIQADANKQRSIAGEDWRRDRDPARSSRAVKEYLASLDDTAWGAASDVVPKFVSPSDPAAQWTGAHKGPAFFAYSDNYLIDVKFGVIVDVEASRSIRQAEVGAAKTMIERTEERFGLKPVRLVGDTAYGAAPMLNWLVEEKAIAPHIPVFDKSKRDDGTFSRSDFRYDPTGDVYHCPGGKRLGTSGTVHEGKTLLYRASKLDCDVCPLKPQCCPKEPSRKIPRDIHEHARDVARSLAGTDGFEQSRRERKKIEMRFAHLKRILRLGRLRLRGPRGAQDEFVLAAIAQNLRRLVTLVARPPPAQAQCIA